MAAAAARFAMARAGEHLPWSAPEQHLLGEAAGIFNALRAHVRRFVAGDGAPPKKRRVAFETGDPALVQPFRLAGPLR